MKKLLSILTLCIGLCCVSCYDDSALIERIDALEKTAIASLEASIGSLEAKDVELKALIQALEESDKATFAEIQTLKDASAAIEKKITELKEWVEKLIEEYYKKEEVDKQIDSINTEIDALDRKVTELENKLNHLLRDFTISFDDSEIGILAGGTTSVGYTITGATEQTTVKALGQNGWSAKVTPDGPDKGKITVTAPNPLTEDEIIVLVYDGDYRTIMSSINFVTGVVTPSQTAVELEAEAGIVDITVTSNLNYKVSIPDEAKLWLSVVETKTTKTETITFAYTANNGNIRRCLVYFTDNNGQIISSITFVQKKVIVMEDAIDLSVNGTANCYMIPEAGWFKFNASVKGNSQESVGELSGVEILWETFNTNEKPQEGDILSKVLLSDNYIYLKTSDDYKNGNALVAVKDINGVILWSWHIWLTAYNPTIEYDTYTNSGAFMMNRDLGALSNDLENDKTVGLFYQWGRKDPFVNDLYMKTNPENTREVIETDNNIGTISYSISNPTTFITFQAHNENDWLMAHDDNLWNENKTMYDPCPIGWKVPFSISDNTSTWYKFTSAKDSELHKNKKGVLFGSYYSIPDTWYRISGRISGKNGQIEKDGTTYGAESNWWSNNVSQYGSPYLFEVMNDGDGFITYGASMAKATGNKVRCIKE